MREDADFVRFAASGAAFGSSYVRADDAQVLANFIKRVTKKEGEGASLDEIANLFNKDLKSNDLIFPSCDRDVPIRGS